MFLPNTVLRFGRCEGDRSDNPRALMENDRLASPKNAANPNWKSLKTLVRDDFLRLELGHANHQRFN